MKDPYLLKLVQKVEAGAECPKIWMTLESGDRVSGTPCPSREFIEGTCRALVQRHDQSKEARRKRGDERQAFVEANANKDIESFNVQIDVTDGEVITLADAAVLWVGRDDGARLPVVRINLSSVATWWLAGGKEIKGGPAFFVGVAVPLS